MPCLLISHYNDDGEHVDLIFQYFFKTCFPVQESQVTVECIIAQADHRTVMGSGGTNVREITKNFDVGIKFPDKPAPAQQNGG